MRPCICLCHWSITATEHTSVRSGHTEHLNPFYTWCLMDSAHICKETWTTIHSNDLWWSWKRGNVAPLGVTPLVLHSVQSIIAKLIVKKVVYKKKFCIPWNDLSLGIWAASGLKHFISALTHISVDVYSFIWLSTVRNELSCYWTLVWQLLVVAALDADHPGLGLHSSFHCASGSVCGVSPAIQTYRAVLGEWI